MMDDSLSGTLLADIVIAPGLLFLVHAIGWSLGWQTRERTIRGAFMVLYAATTLAMAGLALSLWETGAHSVTVRWGDSFRIGDFGFPLILVGDGLSLSMMFLTLALVGIAGAFSSRNPHREGGFGRFYAFMHLFAFSCNLAFAAGSFNLLVAGWELASISFVFLVAFFYQRPEPVQNAMRVFATYCGCDVGMLVALTILRHVAGAAATSSLFNGPWPFQTEILGMGTATVAGTLLLLGASGKSAQAPFSGWLPAVMEGSVPSTAILFSAISVHAGIYLLLRSAPVLYSSPWTSGAVVTVGAITAIHAFLSGRVATDPKVALAYATIMQAGLIFVEIGLGFEQLALFHAVSHSVVRTLQFLGTLPGPRYGRRVQRSATPAWVKAWSYRLALYRCQSGSMLDRGLIAPLTKLASACSNLEKLLVPNRRGTVSGCE